VAYFFNNRKTFVEAFMKKLLLVIICVTLLGVLYLLF